MPLFEFKCNDCGHITTELMKREEVGNLPIPCDKCESIDLVRVISSTGKHESEALWRVPLEAGRKKR